MKAAVVPSLNGKWEVKDVPTPKAWSEPGTPDHVTILPTRRLLDEANICDSGLS